MKTLTNVTESYKTLAIDSWETKKPKSFNGVQFIWALVKALSFLVAADCDKVLGRIEIQEEQDESAPNFIKYYTYIKTGGRPRKIGLMCRADNSRERSLVSIFAHAAILRRVKQYLKQK